MTEQQAIQKLVTWCNGEVGSKEGENNWNKYAADPLLTKLLGWNAQCQEWCDIFTDEGFIVCFGLENASKMTYQPIGKGSAACRYSAQFFKNNNAFFYRPQVGDIIFFISAGAINHQGIVTGVSSLSVTSVEGNSSDQVSRRVRPINDASIAGYGRPKWSVVANLSENPTSSNSSGTSNTSNKPKLEGLPLLGVGDDSQSVWAAQTLLIGYGQYCGGKIVNGREEADGEFGKKTEQATINFQAARGLTQDGKIGAYTWAALLGLGG